MLTYLVEFGGQNGDAINVQGVIKQKIGTGIGDAGRP